MPSRPPVTVQPSTRLGAQIEAERDVDPLRVRARQRADRAVADLDDASPDVDPVQLGAARRRRRRARRSRRRRTSIPFSPPRTVTFADGHVVGGDRRCRRGRPRPARRRAVCAWSRTSGPWWTPAASVTVGGCDRPRDAEHGERARRAPPPSSAPAGAAELAAVLGLREPQERQARVRRAPARRARTPAKNDERGRERRARARAARASAIVRPSSSSPSGSASQPGWYGSSRW